MLVYTKRHDLYFKNSNQFSCTKYSNIHVLALQEFNSIELFDVTGNLYPYTCTKHTSDASYLQNSTINEKEKYLKEKLLIHDMFTNQSQNK